MVEVRREYRTCWMMLSTLHRDPGFCIRTRGQEMKGTSNQERLKSSCCIYLFLFLHSGCRKTKRRKRATLAAALSCVVHPRAKHYDPCETNPTSGLVSIQTILIRYVGYRSFQMEAEQHGGDLLAVCDLRVACGHSKSPSHRRRHLRCWCPLRR